VDETAAERNRFLEIRDIFERALEQPAETRALFLSNACGADEHLRRDVQQLLHAHARTQAFFERTGPLQAAQAPAGSAEPASRLIGAYEIEAEIGRGGMGIVYQARRADGAFEKKVALKLVLLDSARPDVMRSFHRERQILANLEHPNIARILDGGETPAGIPYLVMEFVEGEQIDSWADHHRLGVNDRLRLFLQVCAAVEYAHQHLIVHRDLKPSNILVTADGTVKLLDFGIAKVLSEAEDGVQRERSLTLTAAMTPEFASPEQIGGRPSTTGSDVYSLGVILYRLLTGQSPYGHTTSWPGLMYAVCVKEAPKPSSVTASAQLRGELDNIVMMALRKEVPRRYHSVEQFREDISRYLDGRPVGAQGDSVGYHVRKFISRHRIGVAVAALAAVSLVGGTAVAVWQARRADREAASARAVNDFLREDLLAQASANGQAGSNNKPDPNITVRTALDRAAARIGSKFSNQPAVEASIRHTIGRTYTDLGLYPQAQSQLERALELRRRILGAGDADTIESTGMLAAIYHYEGKYEQAEPLYNEALEGHRRSLGEDHKDTLSIENNLAWLYRYQGKLQTAEALFTKVLEKRRRVLGPDDRETLATMDGLASVYQDQRRYAQAEPLMAESLARERRTLGEQHPDTLITMNDLALLYREEGKFHEAEPLHIKVLDNWRHVLGDEHPHTLTGMMNLAMLYMDLGEYPKAEALFNKALETERRVLGEEHPSALKTMGNLAVLYRCEGRYPEAEALTLKVLAARRRVLGEGHSDTLVSLQSLARLYLMEGMLDQSAALYTTAIQGFRKAGRKADPNALAALALARLKQQRYAEAEPLLRESLAADEETGAGLWPKFAAMSMLGESLAGQKKYTEAEPLLLSGHSGLVERATTIPAWRRSELDDSGKRIVQLYTDSGKPDRAAEWRAKLIASGQ
jgi:serine/threonine protein kinase/tetratricopeptide (TPR) repeat protein